MKTRLDCISEYGVLQSINSGTFSDVYKVRHIFTGEIYAMKVMKEKFSSLEEVDNLEEIKCMRILGQHPNIIQLHDVIYEPEHCRLSLILDYMDFDLLRLFSTPSFFPEDILHYSRQLISGLEYIHSAFYIHCDIKPENIMINLRTRELKIGDFGSVMEDPAENKKGCYVCTRWYRAPELLLKCPRYSTAVDVWSSGCVIAEMILKKPLFAGADTVDQLKKICAALHFSLSQDDLESMDADPMYDENLFKDIEPKKESIKEKLAQLYDNNDLIDAVLKMLTFQPSRRIELHDLLNSGVFARTVNLKKITRSSRMLVKSTNDVSSIDDEKMVPTKVALNTNVSREAPLSQKRSCVTFARIFKPSVEQKKIRALGEFPKNKSCAHLQIF